MPDISIVITGHREGVLVGPSIKSALQAIQHAQDVHRVETEIVVVLDRTDEATKNAVRHGLGAEANVIYADHGDPAQSRNCGARAAKGKCVAFLDADDLWSFNWLANAWTKFNAQPDAIWHSECNIVFGKEHNIWWHVDSDSALFDKSYLTWANYWDALSFAARDIYLDFPFQPNDLSNGYGHEDWDWNRITFAAGLAHKIVPETIHFKRRRYSSQMSKVSQSDAWVRPLGAHQAAALVSKAIHHVCIGDRHDGAAWLHAALRDNPQLTVATPAGRGGLNGTDGTVGWRPGRRRPTLHFVSRTDSIASDESYPLRSTLSSVSKAIVFVRNPVEAAAERLAYHAFEKGNFRGEIPDETLVALLREHRVSIADQLQEHKDNFQDRLLIIPHGDIAERPTEVINRVLSFLDLETQDQSSAQQAENAPASSSLKAFSARQLQIIANHQTQEAERLAVLVPDFGEAWLKNVKELALGLEGLVPDPDSSSSMDRLLRVTESLGDNCEYGFFQRYAGYEPSSLFRWSVTPIEQLIDFIDNPREVFQEDRLEMKGSALIYDAGAGFYFHSELMRVTESERRLITEEEGWSVIYKKEKNKMDYLYEKFFRDLASKPALYVVKSNPGVSLEQAQRLLRSLRTYNDEHMLLRVVADDQISVKHEDDGLYTATINKFAAYESANIIERDSWNHIYKLLLEYGNVKSINSLVVS